MKNFCEEASANLVFTYMTVTHVFHFCRGIERRVLGVLKTQISKPGTADKNKTVQVHSLFAANCFGEIRSIALSPGGGGGGVLPYMGYIGMCGPKGYGFSAVLVLIRVSIFADFGHFGHK